MPVAPADVEAEQPGNETVVNRPRKVALGWGALIAGLAVVAAGIGVWDAVKYRFLPKRFGVVVPGEIYRSGQLSKWQFVPTIQKHGIEVVIDLNGVDPADEHQAAEIAAYETLGLENYRFKLEGNGTGIVENYISALTTLARCHREGKRVLVHCHAGTQRTGSVVAAYRVLVLRQSPQEAYAELSRYGWNPDTDQALLLYLNGNIRHVAEELVRRGVLDQVPDPIPVVGP
jgi:protein tyrosine/serine phosphatase